MALLDLRRRLGDLDAADRRLAERLLARPTNPGDPAGFWYSPDADVTDDCRAGTATPGSHVCVHWARKGDDAPSLTPTVGGIPQQVALTRDVANEVWDQVVNLGGYLPPPGDGGSGRGDPGNPDDKLDIYLMDIGPYGYYGYCATEGNARHGSAPSYCVVDDDFSRDEFPLHSPVQNLEVTVAHEFFHAVQFRYDVGEDLWFMEGTAAWVEDELYDDVDDNRQYLQDSPLTSPNRGLDTHSVGRNVYSSWIFWRFLTERFPQPRTAGSVLPDLMRDAWSRARFTPASPGTWSLRALRRALKARGTAFAGQFSAFGEAARHPAKGGHFEEGRAYPAAPVTRRYRLSRQTRSLPWTPITVHQLGTATVAFKPAAGLSASRWRLRVEVDAPPKSRGSRARLTVYRKDGAVRSRVLPLDRTGAGRRGVAFRASAVRRVELTLSNASTRFECGIGTERACGGRPLDNHRVTRYRATVLRPG